MSRRGKPRSKSVQLSAVRSRYLSALRSGDSQLADQIIEQTVSAEQLDPARVYLEVLLPVQRLLGELWAGGEMSVAEEHRATQITLGQMDLLRRRMQATNRNEKRAVVAAAEGEEHHMSCRVFADFLLRDGWTVDCLGSSTPRGELAAFVGGARPDLLALSATVVEAARDLKKTIQAAKAACPGLPIIVGGAAFERQPELLDDLGHDAYASDVPGGVRRSRELVGLPQAALDLSARLKTIGRRVREIRAAKGLRQQDLAEQAQLDRAYLSTLEHGRQNVTVGAMLRLANALGVDLEDLICCDAESL